MSLFEILAYTMAITLLVIYSAIAAVLVYFIVLVWQELREDAKKRSRSNKE